MIAYLKGKVLDIRENKLIIDVAGVGYLVNMPSGSYLVDQDVSLYIYTAVRENEISLWGFKGAEELELFDMLLGVSGVGLKTAYAIMTLGISKIVQAIATEDPQMLRLPGVGSKTGERIILDMRGKIDMSKFPVSQKDDTSGMSESNNMVNEASIALESLGYRKAEVEAAIKRVKLSDYQTASELVKGILVNI